MKLRMDMQGSVFWYAVAATLMVLFSGELIAQHSDVRVSEQGSQLVMIDQIAFSGGTDSVFAGNFPTVGFSIRATEDPGFRAELVSGDSVTPGTRIDMEVLESPAFGSWLTYYDPDLDAMGSTEATFRIIDNGGSQTADLEITQDAFEGQNPQVIATASGSGQLHSHIDFRLSADADGIFGAYGVQIRLVSSDSEVLESEPAWLVFNYGMDPADFAEFAVPAFADSGILLGDVNRDGSVNLSDIPAFVDILSSGGFLAEADISGNGSVGLEDIPLFVDLLAG